MNRGHYNAGDCRHFTDVLSPRCLAGVRYASVRSGRPFGLPCLQRHSCDDRAGTCAALEPLSELEAHTQSAALSEAFDDVFIRGMCGECGRVLEVIENGDVTVKQCPVHGFAMRECKRISEMP